MAADIVIPLAFCFFYLLRLRSEMVVMLETLENDCCLQMGTTVCIDEVAGFIVVSGAAGF